jgi:hypothetical protein
MAPSLSAGCASGRMADGHGWCPGLKDSNDNMGTHTQSPDWKRVIMIIIMLMIITIIIITIIVIITIITIIII